MRRTLTSSLYETSQQLFANYPLASDEDNDGTARSMVLLLADGDKVHYFVLSERCGDGRSWYSISPWPAGAGMTIEADDGGPFPGVFATAVSHGIPLPRDGSLVGWTHDGIVTALIAIYTEYSPEVPEPCWSVLPCADLPEARWPPFTSEQIIGNWFWDFAGAGKIVSVDTLIAGTPETVFWVDTEATLGSDCCVVARDIRSPDGFTLQRGRYVYHEVLRACVPVPPIRELLCGSGKTDLARRFR